MFKYYPKHKKYIAEENYEMKRNNLFEFATGELSQDAFLCWCANWTNFKNETLFEMGRAFVERVSDIHDIRSVDIYRQYEKIDVLLIVNDAVAVIIEDKTFTSEHDNQIIRYKDILNKKMKNGELVIEHKKYNITDIKTIFLKTGNFYSYDEQIAQSEFVDKVINRKDMMEFVKGYVTYSEIVNDFYLRLVDLDNWYRNFEDLYQEKNYDEALKEHWGQYFCAKDIFGGKKMFGEFSNANIIIENGSSFGRPYTWIWLWGKKDWYWLGYRIDCDNQGYFISLRLYRNCKNAENESIILNQKKEMYDNMKYRFKELSETYGLKVKLGGNRSGYNESEIGKLYFYENDIGKLKDNLYDIAKELVLGCVPEETI